MNTQSLLEPPSESTAGKVALPPAKFLVVDEIPVRNHVFKRHLQRCFPEASIDVCNKPLTPAGYNVYFVSDDFKGEDIAAELVTSIRDFEPSALIVAVTEEYNVPRLRSLIKVGCNTVYDRIDADSSSDARTVIKNYMKSLPDETLYSESSRPSFFDTVNSVLSLIKEWNKRLESSAI